jgi:hypothetical protein
MSVPFRALLFLTSPLLYSKNILVFEDKHEFVLKSLIPQKPLLVGILALLLLIHA